MYKTQAVTPEKFFLLIFSRLCKRPCLGAVYTTFLLVVDCGDQKSGEIRDKKVSGNLEIHYYFTHEETETQRGGVVYLRLHS